MFEQTDRPLSSPNGSFPLDPTLNGFPLDPALLYAATANPWEMTAMGVEGVPTVQSG